jgi:hypothetical protein
MNAILAEYLAATSFDEYQALRDQLLDMVTDNDLVFRLGGTNVALGELCREIGEIEHAYVESFRTFRQEFNYRHSDPAIDTSVAALRAWYTELDRRLVAALEALSEKDMGRHIVRSDFSEAEFSPVPTAQLTNYREALLIFYGKASTYIRALSKPFPDQWARWIG